MAAQAVEQLEPEIQPRRLSLVPPLAEGYQFVDDIPAVYAARLAVREEAVAIQDSKRDTYAHSAEDPVSIDALSAADKVLSATNPEDQAMYDKGLFLDCQRLVDEWYRKTLPEAFAEARHVFDASTEDFYSHGRSIREMTNNALVPIPGNKEEEDRRVNESVEEATPHVVRRRYLGKAALKQEVTIRTISECSDKAIQAYEIDQKLGRPHQGYGGYVPEIKKLMIRDIRLSGTNQDRFQKQIGLPGIYITHEIILMALERAGLQANGMSKTELHGAQFLAYDDQMDFVRLLDDVASEQWCTNIYLGEEVPHDFVKDYAGFREEARQRQEGLRGISETVAQYVLDLARDGTNRLEAPTLVENFVKYQLLRLAKDDSTVAEQMFDERTAQGLQEVNWLEQMGRTDEARLRMDQVFAEAPGGGYCGVGSCGIAEFDLIGLEAEAMKEKLKARPGDIVVKDNERRCVKCGKQNLYYAYNSEPGKAKVNTACLCGATKQSVGMVSSAPAAKAA